MTCCVQYAYEVVENVSLLCSHCVKKTLKFSLCKLNVRLHTVKAKAVVQSLRNFCNDNLVYDIQSYA